MYRKMCTNTAKIWNSSITPNDFPLLPQSIQPHPCPSWAFSPAPATCKHAPVYSRCGDAFFPPECHIYGIGLPTCLGICLFPFSIAYLGGSILGIAMVCSSLQLSWCVWSVQGRFSVSCDFSSHLNEHPGVGCLGHTASVRLTLPSVAGLFPGGPDASQHLASLSLVRHCILFFPL